MKFVRNHSVCVLVAIVAATTAIAQTHSFGGLGKRVEVRADDDGVYRQHLRHMQAVPSTDTKHPFDKIVISGSSKPGATPRAELDVHSWVDVGSITTLLPQLPSAEASIIGTKEWVPVYSVVVYPWKTQDDRLWVADSFDVKVRFDDNPQHVVLSRSPKKSPMVLSANDPQIKLTTRVQGIAVATAANIAAVSPDLVGNDIGSLALFYKNREQHIHVNDNNSNGVFDASDNVVFLGRHPEGDTSYLDWDDSVAVFFLASTNNAQHLRYQTLEQRDNGGRLQPITVAQHLELDTGYYHLGSGPDVVATDYNSSNVYMEGFYWDALNANSYENVTVRFPLAPVNGSEVRVYAHYGIATNAPAFKPDSRVDVELNNVHRAFEESDGIKLDSLGSEVTSSMPFQGEYSLKVFSTGIEEHRRKPGYFSEVLLDWVEIQAEVYPILTNGRIAGSYKASNESTPVRFYSATSGNGYLIDTTNNLIAPLADAGPSSIIQAGLAPSDNVWSLTPWDGTSWRASVIADGQTVSLDTITQMVLVRKNGSEMVVTHQSSGQLANNIRNLNIVAPFALFCPGTPVPADVRSAMQQVGLDIPNEKHWIISGQTAVSSTTKSTQQVDAFGVVYLADYGDRRALAAVLPPGPERYVVVSEASAVETPGLQTSNVVGLADNTQQVDMLIISHPTHLEQANRLAAHRETHSGLQCDVVNIEAVLDEFGGGHRSAEALRSYIAHRYANSNLPRLKYVLLVGNASWDPRMVIRGGNAGSRRADQVPTYGRPSADYYFGLLDDPNDFAIPEAIVGRLPGETAEENKAIVDKIIFNDVKAPEPWNRRFMFVGGGAEIEGLCELYEDLLSDPFQTGITFTDAPLCLDTLTLCKYTAPPNAGFFIRQGIDAGVSWMNYIGHGATDVFDITGWEPIDLTNEGRYGVLATYACQTGAYSNPSVECKNSQYLTTPNKGFVASVGGTGWAFKFTIDFLHYRVHETLRNQPLRSIGEVIYEAKRTFGLTGDQNGKNTVMQYCILGDPSMNIGLGAELDPYIRQEDVRVSNSDGGALLTDQDPIAVVDVAVQSAGIGTTNTVDVWVMRTFEGRIDTLQGALSGLCLGDVVQFEVPIADMQGEHQLSVVVDPFRRLEDNTANNVINTVFTVLPRSLLPVHPLAHRVIDPTSIHVRVLDPPTEDATEHAVVMAFATKNELHDSTLLLMSAEDQIQRNGSVVDWRVNLGTQPIREGEAWLHAFTRDEFGTNSAPLIVPVFFSSSRVESDTASTTPANRLTFVPKENVTLNTETQTASLAEFSLNGFIRSSGIKTEFPARDPFVEIKIGDVLYVSNPFYRGLNIVVVNEVDTLPIAIRRYDTYEWPLPPAPDGHSGHSHEAISFLRDSVKPGERVLIASADESFTGFIKDNNFDTLRQVLKDMGSFYADSLSPFASWAFIGMKGLKPGEAAESFKAAPDSMVTLNAPIRFVSERATGYSPWYGPSRSFASLHHYTSGDGATVFVESRDANGAIRTVVEELTDTVWTASSTDTMPYYRLGWHMAYQAGGESTHIHWAGAEFVPSDEWITIPDELRATPELVLRGDTVAVGYALQTANVFRNTKQTTATIRLEVENDVRVERELEVGEMTASSTLQSTEAFASTPGAKSTSVVFITNPAKNQRELHSFNNTATTQFSVFNDTVRPTIKTWADGREIVGKGYVVAKPVVEVRIHDNSKLPINDIANVTVFVNGDRIREQTAEGYVFLPTDSVRKYYTDTTLRAVMRFEYAIEPGQNNLLCRAKDATGNEAEITTELWLASSTQITSIVASPNPSQEEVTFTVSLQSPMSSSASQINIFNMNGARVRTLKTDLVLGSTQVVWDGRTDNGESLPTGMYVYRLETVGTQQTEAAAANGTLMILR